LNTESSKNVDPRSPVKRDRTGAKGQDLFFAAPGRDDSLSLPPQPVEVPAGMPLEQYAISRGVHMGEVWRLIRCGELIARPIKGALYVFSDSTATAMDHRQGAISASHVQEDETSSPSTDVAAVVMDAISTYSQEIGGDEDAGELPSLPPEAADSTRGHGVTGPAGNSRSLANFPEMALLLDHLSLAKEENKEIIRLTQDTIQRVTAMSENIVAMKNEIIEAKDAQIDILKERLDEQSLRIRSLNQEKEDLEMLARSIAMDEI
jgi:hypothetical protein